MTRPDRMGLVLGVVVATACRGESNMYATNTGTIGGLSTTTGGGTSLVGAPTGDLPETLSATATGGITSSEAPTESTTEGSTAGTTSSGSSAENSTLESIDDSTGSSTDASEPCSSVYHGTLIVDKNTDLASLADIGHVAGDLYIYMQDREQSDLTFLACLHTIDDALDIQNNFLLESTQGLENLQNVSRIQIMGNNSLHSIEGFGPIIDLFSLKILVNPALEKIHFDSIETIGALTIGVCDGENASALHPNLVDLTGFSGLRKVQMLQLEGNEALLTADLLDMLAVNGDPSPLGFATIRYNLLLPEGDVHAQLDALGLSMQFRDVCGNAEGDPECYCVVG